MALIRLSVARSTKFGFVVIVQRAGALRVIAQGVLLVDVFGELEPRGSTR